jgi:2-methylisocitrate lyase-like PEP mutase family enzyme
MTSDLASKAEALRQAHHQKHPLVLANAWDVTSARAIVAAGFGAVATSSGALVRCLGYEDGGSAPPDEVFAVLSRISRAVEVPVSADLEDGYRLTPEELVARMLSAGVVGCNLEDADYHGTGPLLAAEDFTGFVHEVKEAGRAAGVDVVVNARTDVFLREVGAPEGRREEALRRGRMFFEAGADCVFVPMRNPLDEEVRAVVGGLQGPVNMLSPAQAEVVAHFAALGAARISVGSSLAQRVVVHLNDILGELHAAVPLNP